MAGASAHYQWRSGRSASCRRSRVHPRESHRSVTVLYVTGFCPVAVAATNKTNFAVDMHAMAAVMGMLKQHIARLVSRLPCTTVALIFESSERGDPLVQQ